MCMNDMKRNNQSCCATRRLIYEKSIDLNDNKCVRSVLCIGLDPENQFQVAARIQVHNTGEMLTLDSREFRGLLQFLEFEKTNIFNGFKLKNSSTSIKRYKIKICLVDEAKENKYAVVAHDHTIHIDGTSLKRLCSIRNYIQRLKQILEQQSNKSETEFLKLMNHFYYNKTVREARIECECIEKRTNFLEKNHKFPLSLFG